MHQLRQARAKPLTGTTTKGTKHTKRKGAAPDGCQAPTGLEAYQPLRLRNRSLGLKPQARLLS